MFNAHYSGYPQQQQPCQIYGPPNPPQQQPYQFGAQIQGNQHYGQLIHEKSVDELMQLYLPNDQQPPPYPLNGIYQNVNLQQQQRQSVSDQLDLYLRNLVPAPKPRAQREHSYPQYLPQQQPYSHLNPLYDRLPDIPLLTEELSKNLDPVYSKELDILYVLLYNATSKEELGTIFSGFAKQFLVLPSLWKYRLQLQSQQFMQVQSDAEIQITRRALHDFYSIDTFSRKQSFKCFDRIFLSGMSTYFNPFEPNLAKRKEDWLYPHQYLVDAYNYYESHGDQILLQKDYLKYKKVLRHCHKIIAAESLRQLFCCFTEIEDDPKAVIQNVEVIIAQNPTCQWLWKSYLQFLRDRQPKVYLDVFHKYIRFFISDKLMIQYYENERQRIYSTINLNMYQSLENFLMDDIKHESKPLHSLRLHNASTFQNAYEQKLSLPPTLIKYILKKASAKQLNTLFETCKQIFLLQQTPICCNLTVLDFRVYDENNSRSPCFQQSFKFSSFVPWELQNIFLVKSLNIENPKPATMLSSIIGKISRCEIWSLNVKGQTIFWDELKFLLESGNIEKFVFMGGYIAVGYGHLATIEDVIEMLPKAHTVNMDSPAFTPQTFTKLSALNRFTKFKEFRIENITPCFRIFDFECFIMKHAAAGSHLNFVFEPFTTNDFIKKFNNFVAKFLFKDWPYTECRPLISITKKKK